MKIEEERRNKLTERPTENRQPKGVRKNILEAAVCFLWAFPSPFFCTTFLFITAWPGLRPFLRFHYQNKSRAKESKEKEKRPLTTVGKKDGKINKRNFVLGMQKHDFEAQYINCISQTSQIYICSYMLYILCILVYF